MPEVSSQKSASILVATSGISSASLVVVLVR